MRTGMNGTADCSIKSYVGPARKYYTEETYLWIGVRNRFAGPG